MLFTSNNDGSGLLGRVAHVVAGDAAVDAGILGGDGRQREGAVLHHTLLWQRTGAAGPGEGWRRLSSCGDAHQRHRLPWIHHNWILHQQLYGGWSCRRTQELRSHCVEWFVCNSVMFMPFILKVQGNYR